MRNIYAILNTVLFAFAVASGLTCHSQAQKDFRYRHFEGLIRENAGDTAKALTFTEAWLKKAKAEQNWKQMAGAYKAILDFSPKKSQIAYTDSMIVAAKRSGANELIGAAYLRKGLLLYETDKESALENYLLADRFISQTEDKYLIHKVHYVLADAKYFLGYYHEAISLLLPCLDFFASENDRGYINTCHALALCYTRVGNIPQSDEMIALGSDMAQRTNIHQMDHYFDLASATNDFYKADYAESIENLLTLRPYLRLKKDWVNLNIANFYLAMNYWKQGRKEMSVPYLKAVDSAFSDEKYLRPELRKNYEMLINYYKEKGDVETKDYYVGQLLRADSILDRNFEFLFRHVQKEYDTRQLISERDEKNTKNERFLYYVIGAISLVLALSVIGHFVMRRRIRHHFKLAMQREPEKEAWAIEDAAKERKIIVNGERLENLLYKLRKFESDKKFLDKNVTSTRMATLFQTNPKYISEIIRHYRGKRVNEYVNDLKIDYIIDMLKTDARFRLYTNEALAAEAGFGSTQIFTRAFKKSVKISPTQFVEQLRDEPPEMP